MAKMVDCIKLGTQAEGLDFQPWPGELGEKIFNNVSKQAWQEWLRQQTILINEYKLNPLDAEHKKYLAEQMQAYFFGEGIVMPDQWQAQQD
ncbi:MAG: oxidative damage protection protein [bacterium]